MLEVNRVSCSKAGLMETLLNCGLILRSLGSAATVAASSLCSINQVQELDGVTLHPECCP